MEVLEMREQKQSRNLDEREEAWIWREGIRMVCIKADRFLRSFKAHLFKSWSHIGSSGTERSYVV